LSAPDESAATKSLARGTQRHRGFGPQAKCGPRGVVRQYPTEARLARASPEHTLLGELRRGCGAPKTLGETKSLSSPILLSSSSTFFRQKETELTPCGRARDTALDEVAVVVPTAEERRGAERQRARAFPKKRKRPDGLLELILERIFKNIFELKTKSICPLVSSRGPLYLVIFLWPPKVDSIRAGREVTVTDSRGAHPLRPLERRQETGLVRRGLRAVLLFRGVFSRATSSTPSSKTDRSGIADGSPLSSRTGVLAWMSQSS
jgi:hypothetical protein